MILNEETTMTILFFCMRNQWRCRKQVKKLSWIWFRYSFICQVVSTRRQRRGPVTTSL